MALMDAAQAWLTQTTEEDVRFETFPDAKLLRRPLSGVRALAALSFGQYIDMTDKVIDDDRVIWLGMIMSEERGEGARLLEQICRLARAHGLAICGDPVALKPAGWEPARPWMRSKHELIGWYLRHDFIVVQSKWRTRLWHVPPGMELLVQTQLADRATAGSADAGA